MAVTFQYQTGNKVLRHKRKLKDFIVNIFREEETPLQELCYIFCDDAYLLDINKRYLNHDTYTDIITFPLHEQGEPVVGEVYISVDRVRENAVVFGNSGEEELLRVIFHGALHLCGYKDKTKREISLMRQTEDHYLRSYSSEA